MIYLLSVTSVRGITRHSGPSQHLWLSPSPKLSPGASQGEQRLFNVLKTKLPEDFIVWYEPRLQRNLYPDFMILSPSFGRLIIEVKGWFASNIIRLYRIGEYEGRAISGGARRTALSGGDRPFKPQHLFSGDRSGMAEGDHLHASTACFDFQFS
ncbi:MAG: hypothetical protein DCF21_00350 [Leptolyngbya sp.]|nr:MAG: hypothetical protein DCF21_00350 [Leptolyngbya sp.]